MPDTVGKTSKIWVVAARGYNTISAPHATFQIASEEAMRLAREEPGKVFYVYALVGVVEVPPAYPVFTEV